MRRNFPIRGTPDGRETKVVSLPNLRVKTEPRNDPKIVELSSSGFDENLQGIGSDPYGGTSWVGLRVPTLPTPDKDHRYLAMLAGFSLGEGARARIIGYRQLVTIGVKQTHGDAAAYIEEFQVRTPFWRFQDGNVSFHMQKLGPPEDLGFPSPDASPQDVRSFRHRWCANPAVLFEKATLVDQFYVNLTAYTPPNLGRPWGTPLRNGLPSTFVDLRTQWQTHGAWTALDIPCEGPSTYALFASVFQTNPATRPVLTPPGTVYQNGILPEELFLLNFPTAIYWRVGGALIVEFY